jgi:predicted ATPase
MPLALELAAARTVTVPLDRIVRGLDDRFALLVGGYRTALPRQQTLVESVDWSYRLLEPDERVLFRRLGVFAGGFTADAAEQVAGSVPLTPSSVLTLLAALASKSLVQLDSTAGVAPRYRMLETIREFAAGLLEGSGEGPGVRQRHVTWAAYFAGRWEDGAIAAHGDALVAELPNLRAALDHAAVGPVTDDAGLRLVASTAFLWPQTRIRRRGGRACGGRRCCERGRVVRAPGARRPPGRTTASIPSTSTAASPRRRPHLPSLRNRGPTRDPEPLLARARRCDRAR